MGGSAKPTGDRPSPSDRHGSDIRQTPAVRFFALTLPMQQTARPSRRCDEQSGPLASSPFPAPRVQGERSGKGSEVSGLPVWPFVRSKAEEPRAPAPPPPQLPGARVSRGGPARTRAPSWRRRPPPSLRRVPTPRPRQRADPRPYLVDVAVGAAADALNQLEVLLRIPAGQIEAGVHGGPRVPPASLPGRGGGALRGPHGEWEPRPAPCSPAGHNRPAPRCGRCRRSSHAAAAAADDDRANRPRPRSPPPRRTRVTPTRRGERSQPLARGATPTWLPPSPLLPLPLLRLLHPPPPFPGSGPTAQPRSRRERTPAQRACGPVRAPAPRAWRAWAGGLPSRTGPRTRAAFPGRRPALDSGRDLLGRRGCPRGRGGGGGEYLVLASDSLNGKV